MYNILKCEYLKLKRSNLLKIFLPIFLVLAVIEFTMEMFYMKETIKNGMESNLFGIDNFINSCNHNDFIVIMLVIFTAMFVCNDFENRTAQAAIAKGVRKSTIIFGKTAMVFLAAVIMLLPAAIIKCVFFSIFYKFGMIFTVSVLLKMIEIAVLSVTSYFAICYPALVMAYYVKKSGIVITFGILIIFFAGTNFFPYLAGINKIIAFVYYNTPFCLPETITDINISYGLMSKILLVSLIYSILYYAISLIIFEKTELK